MKDTRLSDLLASLAVIGLGILAVVQSASLPTANTGLGSGGYPTVIGWAMIILGGIQLITTLVKGFKGIKLQIKWANIWPSFAVAGLCLVYYFLLRKIGFLILTPFLLFAVMRIFGYKKLVPGIIISVATTVVIYLLFAKVFMIFLPEFSLF